MLAISCLQKKHFALITHTLPVQLEISQLSYACNKLTLIKRWGRNKAVVPQVLFQILQLSFSKVLARVYSLDVPKTENGLLLYSALHSFIGCSSWRNLSLSLSVSASLSLYLSWMKFSTAKRCACVCVCVSGWVRAKTETVWNFVPVKKLVVYFIFMCSCWNRVVGLQDFTAPMRFMFYSLWTDTR